MGGEIAQSVKCLSCRHEDLSLILRTHIKIPGTVTPVTPGLGRRRQADLRIFVTSQFSLLGDFRQMTELRKID